MWTDEGYTAFLMYLKTPAEVLRQVQRIERRPPLQFMSIWFWSQFAGRSDLSLRYFSVMCTLVATALTFKLGKRVLSEPAGALASLLMATSPTLLLYGRMIRGYGMTMALGVASTLAFWIAWRRKRLADWGVYLICTALLLISDYPALVILAAHLLYVLTQWKDARGHWRRLLLPTLGLCIVLAIFWAVIKWQASPVNIQGFSEPLAFITNVQVYDYARRIPTMLVGGAYMLYSFAFGETIFPWNPVVWVGGAAMLAWLWQILRQYRGHSSHGALFTMTIFLATLIPFCIVVCGFILGGNSIVVTAARGLFIAPCFYLALGLYGDSLSDRRVRICVPLVLLAVRAVSILNWFADPGAVFNSVYAVPVRELATQVARNIQPGDAVIFEEPLPFDLYFRQIDRATPLFTPGPRHYGYTIENDVKPGSPAFLGQGQPSIAAIAPDHLLAYLQENPPSRLWLIVFHHEGTEDTVETEIGQPLVQAGLYEPVLRLGYAPQDPLYARLRAWLRQRTIIKYKAEILLYRMR